MHIEHPFPWRRIALTLEAAPGIVQYLVNDISDAEADFRPDLDRLTIREIVSHLAAWDPIILRHLQRICREEVPQLDDQDHKSADITTGSEPADIAAQCILFAEHRAEMAAFLKGITKAYWSREAIRSVYGPTTLDAQAIIIAMHDTYHIQQIVEWRQLFAKQATAY